MQTKIRYAASAETMRENDVGFSKSLAFSGKLAPPSFGVFQQNRPIAALELLVF